MQLVADKYYDWYNRILIILATFFVVATIGAWFVPPMLFLRLDWGFTPVTGVLGLIGVLYGLFFYKHQNTSWVGALIAAIILSVNTIGLIHNSGQLHSWVLIFWCLQVLIAGMFGLYALVSCDIMIIIYFILSTTGPSNSKLYDPIAYAAMFATLALSAISYFSWKRVYIDHESAKVSQLTKLLKNNQQQSTILIQSIADGVIVTDTEGKINLLNPTAAKMTGWSVEEAENIDVQLVANLAQEDGRPLPDSFYPFHQVLKDGQQYTNVLQLLSKGNSTPSVVSLNISPVVIPGKKELAGTVAVLRDVSASRQEEHRRADFISTASHEMRTPVAAIEGYLALALNDKVSHIDAKAREFLIKAHESTQHLGTLFQDLLTSAKAEDGRLVNHPRVVEVGEYLQKISDDLKFAAEKKGLLMDFTVGSNEQDTRGIGGGKVIKPLYYAHIDPDRIREVITNLFDNAVKYTETGKISIGLTGNESVIQLFIKDTGHGIPPEDIPHLFQKFYRVDNSTTRTIGGTGLGLFISRKIIELYNGRIWVESELNKGSTFYINLPRLSNQKAQALQATETQPGL